jgi:hypothetical protein
MLHTRATGGNTGDPAATAQPPRPLISVIIACYNYELYVGQAIESVLSQDYENKEIIVIDDGSTDSSWHKIQRYSPLIKAIQIKNSGQARACVAGVRASRGDFIYILDADDILKSNALGVIASHCHPQVAKIQFPLSPTDASGHTLGAPFPILNRMLTSSELISQIETRGTYETPPTSGNVFRRDTFDFIGDISNDRCIDGVTCLLSPFIGDVVTLEAPLVSYRVHQNNQSNYSKLTTQRFREEASRFSARLEHLLQICRQHGLPLPNIHRSTEFSFVCERNLLAAVAIGKRPSIADVRKFTRALRRERYSWRRSVLLAAWAFSLTIVPNANLGTFAALRSNPWSRGAALRWLKQHSVRRAVSKQAN